jgi:hypothetical protein
VAKPLHVEIVVYAPTLFFHCQHCEVVWRQTGFSRGVRAEQRRSGLPEDMQRDYDAVSGWARRLLATYRDRVAVEVIDVASATGLWRSLRYGLHSYPAVIVERRERFSGRDLSSADAHIADRLGVLRADTT